MRATRSKNRRPTRRPLSQSLSKYRSALAIASALTMASAAEANFLYWDPYGDQQLVGGPGSWDTVNPFWADQFSPPDLNWDNTLFDTAIFTGFADTGEIIMEQTGIVASGLIFDVSGYTIRFSNSADVLTSTLTLNTGFGATPLLEVTHLGDTGTISSVLAGSNGFEKVGLGTLVLRAGVANMTNTITGGVLVSEGRLEIGGGPFKYSTGNGLKGSPTIAQGATLRLGQADVAAANLLFTVNGTLDTLGQTISRLTGNGDITNTGGLSTIKLDLANASDVFSGKFKGALDVAVLGRQATAGVLQFQSGNTYLGNTTIGDSADIGSVTLKLMGNDAIPDGYNRGDVTIVGTGTAGRGGILDLNGFNDTINGLNGATSTQAPLITNSAAGKTSILTIGSGNGVGTFAGVIQNGAGTIAITKTGVGTQTLSGANTYSGQTLVTGGKLIVGSATGLGNVTGNTVVSNGGALEIAAAGVAEAITISGRGVEVPPPVSGTSGIGGSTGPIYSGALLGTGTVDVSGAITMLSDSYIGSSSTASNFTINSIISGGAFGLTKVGPGIVTLTKHNTFTGPLTLQAGELRLNNTTTGVAVDSTVVNIGDTSNDTILTLSSSNQLPSTVALNFNNGTKNAKFQLNGLSQTVSTLSNTGTLAIIQNLESGGAGTGTLTVNSASDSTFAGYMRDQTGTLALTKAGTGTLTLAASVDGAHITYTGNTTISGGKLVLRDTAATTASTASFNSPIINNVAGAAGLEFQMNYGRQLDYGKLLSGTGGFTKTGAGTLRLTILNSFGGPVAVNGGVLQIRNASALSSSAVTVASGAQLQLGPSGLTVSNPITLNGGTLVGGVDSAGTETISGTLTLAQNSVVTSFSNDRIVSVTGQVTGAGALVIDRMSWLNNPTLVSLTNATNNYSGGTIINAGILRATDGTNIPAAGSLTFGSGYYYATGATTGSAQLENTGTATFSRNVGTGAGQVQWLNGSEGGFSAQAGKFTISFGNAGALAWGSTAGWVPNGGSLVLNAASSNNEVEITNALDFSGSTIRRIVVNDNGSVATDVARFSGVLSGTGGTMLKEGAGPLILSGASANTYNGLTQVSGGFLRLAKTAAGTDAIVGNVHIGSNSGNAFLELNQANQIADSSVLNFTGITSNVGGFKLLGFNETVAGISDRSGGGVIEETEADASLPAGGAAGGSTLTINNSANFFYNGALRDKNTSSLSAKLTLAKTGSGTLTIGYSLAQNASLVSLTGGVSISGGKLQFYNAESLAVAITNNVAGAGGLEFTNTFGRSQTLATLISGTGGLTKSGVGTLTLNASNSYSGPTQISAGTLIIGGSPSGTGTFTIDPGAALTVGTGGAGAINNGANVTDNGTLNFNRTGSYTYTGAVSGTGNVVNVGAGTVTLAGANNYTGTTTVNAGTLVLGGSGASTGGLVAASGTTLTIDYSQTGSSTANVIGSGAPVTLTAATLNFTGKASTANTQTLGNVLINSGLSTITPTAGASGSLAVNFGTFSRAAGGYLAVNLAAGVTLKTVAGGGTGGILSGWATTSSGTTWVAVDAGGTMSALSSFTNDTWSGGNVDVTANSTQSAGATANSIRFNTANARTVTLSGTNTLTTGGILITSNVGANASTITGGSLRPAAGNDLTIFQNSTGTLTIGSSILDNGGPTNILKIGSGALVLAGAASTYTGTTTVLAGSLQFGDGTTSNGAVTGNIIGSSTPVTFANPTAQSYGGTITGATSLTKLGAGNLTLTAANSIPTILLRAGTLTADTGANLTLTGATTLGTTSGDIAALTLTGTGKITTGTDTGIGDANGTTGTLSIQGSTTLTTNNFFVGRTGTAAGFVTQTGGTVAQSGSGTAEWRIAGGTSSDTSTYGSYLLSGGTFSTGRALQIGYAGKGTFVQTGGTVTESGAAVSVGTIAGSTGMLSITGGTFTQSAASNVVIGESGTGTLNIGAAGTTTVGGAGQLLINNASAKLSLGGASGKGTVNLLPGGLILTPGVIDTDSSIASPSTFNFNGGTLRVFGASQTYTTYLQGLASAVVQTGGAFIDTNTNNITIGQAIAGTSGSGVASIAVSTTGSGYRSEPIVTISGGTGTGATARAVISNGQVTGFIVTNPGTGYSPADALTVSITGGGGSGASTGSPALAPHGGVALPTGNFTKLGLGTLTLNAANTFSGNTVLNEGSMTLDFSAATAPASNIISSNSTLVLAGGGSGNGTTPAFLLNGKASTTNAQTFNGLTLTGVSSVGAVSGTSGTVNVNFGPITRNTKSGGVVNFSLPTTGTFTTTTAMLPSGLPSTPGQTIYGGWATVGGTTFATTASASAPYTITGLATFTNDTWIAPNSTQTQIDAANINVTGSSTQTGLVANSLRFGSAGTVTISGTGRIYSGGILVSSAIGGSATAISGGTITTNIPSNTVGSSPAIDRPAADFVVSNYATGTLTISSAIANYNVVKAVNQSAGDPQLKQMPNTLDLYVGMLVTGTGIPAGTMIKSIDGIDKITLTNQPTQTLNGNNITFIGANDLIKAGSGPVTISSTSNSYAGDTIVGSGTLRLGASNVIPDGANRGSVNVRSGATLDLNGNDETINALFGLGSVTNNGGSNRTLTVGTTANPIGSTFDGILSNGSTNTLALTKAGPATLTLTNANTFSGDTNINFGFVNIANSLALQNSIVRVNTALGLNFSVTSATIAALGGSNNFPLETSPGSQPVNLSIGNNNTTNVTYAGAATGAGSITKIGTGTLTLSGANLFTGGLTVAGGTLVVSGNNSGAGGVMTVNNGAVLQLGQTSSVFGSSGRSLLVNTGGLLTFSTGVNVGSVFDRIDSNSTGIVALQVDNSDNLDFAANNVNMSLGAQTGFTAAYTGTMTANGGTYRLGGGGGRLVIAGTNSLNGANGLLVDTFGTSGTVAITAPQSFSGPVTVNNLTLQIVNANGLGPGGGTVTLNNGTLQIIGDGGTSSRTLTLTTGSNNLDSSGYSPVNFSNNAPISFTAASAARTLTLTGNNVAGNVFGNSITDSTGGTTNVVKSGAGTWILTGTNTFTGTNSGTGTGTGVTVNQGVLQFNSPSAIGNSGVAGPATVNVTANGAVAFGGSFLTTPGSIQTALNTRINPASSGTIALTSNSSENIDFSPTGATLPSAFLGAYGNVTYTGTLTPFSSIYRLGGGGGTLTLPNDNALTGARQLVVGGGGPSSNSVALSRDLNGIVVLSGTNDYTGGTTLTAGGILSATKSAALGAGPITFSGGIFRFASGQGWDLSQRTLQIAASGTAFIDTNGNDVTFSQPLGIPALFGSSQGTSNFAKLGAGTLVLSGGIAYNGTTTVQGGTLELRPANPYNYGGTINIGNTAVNSANPVDVRVSLPTLRVGANESIPDGIFGSPVNLIAGGTLELNGFTETVRTINGGGVIRNSSATPATLGIGNANENSILTGNMIGNFTLVKMGETGGIFGTGSSVNTLELWNANNSEFTGKHIVNAGSLKIRGGGSLGAAPASLVPDAVTLNNGAALQSTSGNAVQLRATRGITLGSGGGTLWQNGSTSMIINSPITGSGNLTIADDSGSVFLGGTNTYTGLTTINSAAANRGQLVIGTGGSTGTLAGDVYLNGTNSRLFFFRSNTYEYSGSIRGNGSIVQMGAGTTTLKGNNSYTGPTFVGGGRLLVDAFNGAAPVINGLTIGAGTFEYAGPAGDNTLRAGTLTSSPAGVTLPYQFTNARVGDGTVQSTYGGSGVQSIIFSSLAARTASGTLNFVVSGGVNGETNRIAFNAGAAGVTPSAVLGAGYFFNGTEFAALDADNFVRAPIYGADAASSDLGVSPLDVITDNQHVKLTQVVELQLNHTLPTLNLVGPLIDYGMDQGVVLTMNGGAGLAAGIIKSGGGESIIRNTTGLTNASLSTANQELILRPATITDTLTVDVPITGSGQITKSGFGTLGLSAQNTYSGQTIINQGAVVLTGTGRLGNTSNDVRIANAAGQFASVTLSGVSAEIKANGVLRVGEAGNGILDQFFGDTTVQQSMVIGENLGATGTVNLMGGSMNVKASTSAGSTVEMVVGRAGTGTLNISNGSLNVFNGAQLQLGAGALAQYGTSAANVQIATGNGTVNQTGGNVFISPVSTSSNAVRGAVVIGVDGTGTYNLNGGTLTTPAIGRGNGTATFNMGGGTLIAGTTLAGQFATDLPISLTNSTTSAINTNGNETFLTGAITGGGALTKLGVGNMTLSGANTYSGGTSIAGGTLIAANGPNNPTPLGTGPVTIQAGGTLQIQGVQRGLQAQFYNLVTTGVTSGAAPGVNLDATEFVTLDTFNSFLAGKAMLAVQSTTANNKAAVDFTDTGTLFPDAIRNSFNGFTNIVAKFGGTFTAPADGTYTFSTRSDDGSMIWIDGDLVVSNNISQGISTRYGSVNLSSGDHDIVIGYHNGSGGFGFSVGVTIPGQGAEAIGLPNDLLKYGGNSLTTGGLAGPAGGVAQIGTGTLTANVTGSATNFAGTLSGSAGSTFIKTGSGTQELSGTNAGTFTGAARIDGGTLLVSGSISGVASVQGNNSATVQVSGTMSSTSVQMNNSSTLLVSGTVSGTPVTMNNATTLRMSGGTISGGTVQLNGSSQLIGNGTLGAVNVGPGASVSPGVASMGTLATGNIAFASAASLSIQLQKTTGNGNQPAVTDYDRLNVTGTVTLNDTPLSLTLGAGVQEGDIFYIILNDSSDAVSGIFSGYAQGSQFTLNNQNFLISYTAESGTGPGGFQGGGNDVALMAVPEPSTWAMLLSSTGVALGLQRFRRRRK